MVPKRLFAYILKKSTGNHLKETPRKFTRTINDSARQGRVLYINLQLLVYLFLPYCKLIYLYSMIGFCNILW